MKKVSPQKHTPFRTEPNETKIIMRRNCKEELRCSCCRFNKDEDERSFLKTTSRSCGGGGGGSGGSGESGSRSRLKRKQRGNFDGKKRGGGIYGFLSSSSSSSSSSLIFLLFFFVFFFVCDTMKEVRGEEETTTTSNRINACEMNLLENVNDTVNANFNTRLEGLTLTVAAIWDPGYVSIEGEAAPTRTRDYPDVYCTDCGSQLSGYNFDVFEKMASLGNFKTNWTIFGDVDSSRGETYEQFLEPLNTYIKSIPQGYIFLSCPSFPAIER